MTTYEPPPYAQPQPQGPYYPPARSRPLGVTILAILMIIEGVFLLIGSLGLFGLATLMSSQDFLDQLGQDVPGWILEMGPALFGALGVVLLIMAIVAFFLAGGFLKGKRWAWMIGVIFVILSIVSSVVSSLASLSLANLATMGLSILIPVLILVYLLLPSTKAWFTS